LKKDGESKWMLSLKKIKIKGNLEPKGQLDSKKATITQKNSLKQKGNLDQKKPFNNYKLSHFTNVAPTSMLFFKCPFPLLLNIPTANALS
jgi:hypothetical protein